MGLNGRGHLVDAGSPNPSDGVPLVRSLLALTFVTGLIDAVSFLGLGHIFTAEPTLSRGMRHLNGAYTQSFNRLHGRVGHLLQGWFKAILVERESHLLELARYVVLNPVRAGMTSTAGQWKWGLGVLSAGDRG